MSGSRAERYQVVLHVSAETSAGSLDAGAELEDGTRVSAETSRRVACDAGLVAIGHAPDGAVLDVGRRTRTVPPAIRRALEARDRGCRFPGCGSRFCDAHHVKHWSEGGETKLDNLVLLCRVHHRMLHEGGYRVELVPISAEWRGGGGRDARPSLRANFYDPRGVPLPDAPPAVGGDHLVAALLHDHRLRGVHPDWYTTQPRWRHDDDIPAAVLVRALQAVHPGNPVDPGNRAA